MKSVEKVCNEPAKNSLNLHLNLHDYDEDSYSDEGYHCDDHYSDDEDSYGHDVDDLGRLS